MLLIWWLLSLQWPCYFLAQADTGVEDLHKQLAELRRQNAQLQNELVAARERLAPFSQVKHFVKIREHISGHGPTVFFTLCAGVDYFDRYCGPLLLSFERVYGASGATRHRIVVFTKTVKGSQLQQAQARFGHFTEFISDASDGGMPGEPDTSQEWSIFKDRLDLVCAPSGPEGQMNCKASGYDEQMRNVRTTFDSVVFPLRAAKQMRAIRKEPDGMRFCYFALIDSDMLFVRPLDIFLPDCGSGFEAAPAVDWHAAFTYYDKQFSVPWADSAEAVARTPAGLVRLNCGVALFSLHEPEVVNEFLQQWAGLSEDILKRALAGDRRSAAFLEEFRGPDQTALAFLLVSLDLTRLSEVLGWDSCSFCGQTIEAMMPFPETRKSSTGMEKPMGIRMHGFLARQLNYAESMPCGRFSRDIHIVHLKGLWWRQVLHTGALNLIEPTRRIEWNRDTWEYHQELYREVQISKPDLAGELSQIGRAHV